jgi:hypothetical protein
MVPTFYSHSVPVETLQRGFWLYILTVKLEGEEWHYVGRTGDNGHLKACDPFSRLAMHVRSSIKADGIVDKYNKTNRQGQPNLTIMDVESANFDCYGPILQEQDGDYEQHHKNRRIIAAVENTLIQSMHDAGYGVLNKAGKDRDYDPDIWLKVKANFSERFVKLKPLNP